MMVQSTDNHERSILLFVVDTKVIILLFRIRYHAEGLVIYFTFRALCIILFTLR